VDSKKQLEESLKGACNSFITHACRHLSDGVLSLLDKAQAFLPTSSSNGGDDDGLARLAAQPFMQKDRAMVR
jgi:hypothetical protein